jgi:hypothetical protein
VLAAQGVELGSLGRQPLGDDPLVVEQHLTLGQERAVEHVALGSDMDQEQLGRKVARDRRGLLERDLGLARKVDSDCDLPDPHECRP